ncbi:MAG TPA: hypothetical protein VMJ33_00320 [Gallionella sp.]|nr:hypothetical protein [Gallionella sp.]
MDNKTIFVKTSKGEGEMHGRTSHLPDSLKRALLMVDGTSTFSEISKRAAPSIRASLGETFEELEKAGYIQDKDKVGKTPKIAVPPKMSVPGKMSVPSKPAKPNKQEPVDDEAGELDFLTGFPVTPPEKPAIVPENAKSLMEQAKEKSSQQSETEKINAQKEAEHKLRKAEQEAARKREEAARRAREEAESARLRAEQEARRLREQARADALASGKDASRLLEEAIKAQQQDAEAKRLQAKVQAGKGREEIEPARLIPDPDAHSEAAIKGRADNESLRSLAEEQARKEREELEATKLKIEQEAKQRLEAAQQERERAEAARIKAEQETAQILLEMEKAKQKAEQEAKARLEAEAKARIEAEVKARIEAEAKARLEAEVRARLEAEAGEIARIKAEEEAAKAEQLARQEREAAAREAAARAAEAREAAARAEKKAFEEAPASGAADFAFDSFQVGEPQPTGTSRPAQRPGAANEAARSRREQEKKQREEQERIAAETLAREIAEAEEKSKEEADARAREIGEAQAKVWAEAEQRSLETAAKAKPEKAVYQFEYTPAERQIERPVRATRARRKPFAWGKLVGFVLKLGVALLALLAIALYILPFVLPMRDYMPKVQQLLSARLHQPVHLGNLSGRILPLPRLDLGEIYIGDAKQFQAADAQINFDLAGLFIDEKPVSSVEFHGVKIRGPWVTNVAGWLQQLASQEQYPVSRMVFNQAVIDADAFQLTGVDGSLDFDPAGKFTRADLRSEGGKYMLELIASPGNRFQTTITVRNSALPLLPNWSFDELVAKGELSSDSLLIKHFDARILNGALQGNATLNWRSGWIVQGSLNAKALALKDIDKLLDCKIDGDAHFKMSSANLAGLADSASLDGSFKSSDGVISGMDIVETARRHSKEHLPGGRTHYDTLSGNISFADNIYRFSQVKVDAGVMDTTAAFEVNKQQLSGKMNVKLSIQDAAAPVVLQMGGAIDSPTLVAP